MATEQQRSTLEQDLERLLEIETFSPPDVMSQLETKVRERQAAGEEG